MDKLTLAEQTLVKEEIPAFRAGDTVNVHYRVREGDKERIQQFEGVVISRRGSGPNETFTCRKISFGNIGVERIFLIHSPFIAKIDVVKEGVVRRSKLYYLRERQGKAARIREKDRGKTKKAAPQAKAKAVKEEIPEPKTAAATQTEADTKKEKTPEPAKAEGEKQKEQAENKKPKAASEEAGSGEEE